MILFQEDICNLQSHIPRLEDELIAESKKKSSTSFENVTSEERLKMISSLYEIYVDSIQIKDIQWVVQRKQALFTFRFTKLTSTIALGNFKPGSHELIVRIRSKNKDYVKDSGNPQLNWYAKASFFIDR